MKAEDFEFHERALRHLKGLLAAYASWLEAKKRHQAGTTTPQARNPAPLDFNSDGTPQ